MTREKFLSLSTKEIANIVMSHGSCTCVFPFNGTRRWFLLEHGHENHENPARAYVDLTSKAYTRIYEMLFNHGLDTIVAPIFGGEILSRGNEYMEQVGASMRLLAEHPSFVEFYEKYDVRVHFYGDYRKEFAPTPYAFLTDIFDDLANKTAKNQKHRLFYGVFGNDGTETIARLSVEYYQSMGSVPARRDLIELYYGEFIEKANIFIGFEKFNVFDYPLLSLGEESLYFSITPSLYMGEDLLRNILYDYIYLRPLPDPDYFTMPKDDFEAMRAFYEKNRESAYGIGEVRGGIWYARPYGKWG